MLGGQLGVNLPSALQAAGGVSCHPGGAGFARTKDNIQHGLGAQDWPRSMEERVRGGGIQGTALFASSRGV